MQYYSTLPKEARLQLLIEADYPIILELCNDPLFKEICDSNVLWERKLKNEFGITSDNPKEEYIRNYQDKLKTEIKSIKTELGNINNEISFNLHPLDQKFEIELSRIREKHRKQKEKIINQIKEERGYMEKENQMKKLQELINSFADENTNIIIIQQPAGISSVTIFDDFNQFGPIKSWLHGGNKFTFIFEDYRDAQDARKGLRDRYNFLN